MKTIIKTLALLTAGVGAVAVVRRVSRQNKINIYLDSKKVAENIFNSLNKQTDFNQRRLAQ